MDIVEFAHRNGLELEKAMDLAVEFALSSTWTTSSFSAFVNRKGGTTQKRKTKEPIVLNLSESERKTLSKIAVKLVLKEEELARRVVILFFKMGGFEFIKALPSKTFDGIEQNHSPDE